MIVSFLRKNNRFTQYLMNYQSNTHLMTNMENENAFILSYFCNVVILSIQNS